MKTEICYREIPAEGSALAAGQAYVSSYASPLGRLTLVSQDEQGLSALYFPEERPENLVDSPVVPPVLAAGQRWLEQYFSGCVPGQCPPLSLRGTPFQQTVWQLLLDIPYGQSVCYGDIAARLSAGRGRGSSARAVGGAVGRNPLPILVPCHRVLGKDGRLTGYSSGLDKKIRLLELERIPFRANT